MGEYADDAVDWALNSSLDYDDDDGSYGGRRRRYRNTPRATAGSALARARVAAHTAFDPLWQDRYMTRSDAYRWLAARLGVPPRDCHILYFDEDTCLRVKRLCDVEIFRRACT